MAYEIIKRLEVNNEAGFLQKISIHVEPVNKNSTKFSNYLLIGRLAEQYICLARIKLYTQKFLHW